MNALGWIRDRVGEAEEPAVISSPPSWARAFSVALILSCILCAVSGIGLSFVYAPSVASAWASLFYAEHILAGGWLVRSVHKAAAESAIIFGIMSLMLAAIEGRYRGRRDLAFWCQALVVLLAFGFCITGNPLRWDNRGYYGFQTETNIGAELPGGRLLTALVVGGTVLGNWTLTRLYALHTLLLPIVAGAVIWLWTRVSRRAEETTAPTSATKDQSQAQLTRDVILALVVIVEIFVVAYKVRAPLESPADPVASYNARPEWYFLALYVLRNAVPVKMQALVAGGAPVVLGAIVLGLPLLDRDPSRSVAKRIPYLAMLGIPVLSFVGLTFGGLSHDAHDPVLTKARVSQEKLDLRALQTAKSSGIPPAGALQMMREDPVLHAEDLFKEHCATCHILGDMGPADGKASAPKLDLWSTPAWVLAMLDDPDHTEKFGNLPSFKGQMPSYTHPPTDPQYAKDWKPMEDADRVSVAQWLYLEGSDVVPEQHDLPGFKLIKQRCSGCHLLRGNTDEPDDFAPELAGWGSLSWLRAQIANPGAMSNYRPGSMAASVEGHMPRFDEKLSAADIDLLARFVRSRTRIVPTTK